MRSPALARITARMALRMRGRLAYLPIQLISGMIRNAGVIRAIRPAKAPGSPAAK